MDNEIRSSVIVSKVATNNNSDLPKMSGYRCVNYYELCRLCTASQGTRKVHIFSEEAKKTNLLEKISGCLPIVVSMPANFPFLLALNGAATNKFH